MANINETSNLNIIEITNNILDKIFSDNDIFANSKTKEYFEVFADKQNPRATIVACCDSRFHIEAISANPINDLFVLCNIGNQFQGACGSIEYGVRHLKTPVLMFIGHSNCGAVNAVMELKSHSDVEFEACVSKELQDMVNIKDGNDKSNPHDYAEIKSTNQLNKNAIINVQNQALLAKNAFADLVDGGKLLICGAVYDFSNALGHGYGRLTNIVMYGNLNELK